MRIEDKILNIRDRYQTDPGFPFLAWAKDPRSFFCLINFWDEVFQVAAGEHAAEYRATQDLEHDAASPVYFVTNTNGTKKLRIWTGLVETGEPDVAFYFSRYPDLERPDADGQSYSSSREGVYMLEIACDFDSGRLVAASNMIYDFVRSDTSTEANLQVLDQTFEARFRAQFPLPEALPFDDEND